MELREAVVLLREKLKSRSFRKAVGGQTATAIEMLLAAYECGGFIEPREAAELVNNYYVFESRVRRVLELYNKLTRGSLRAIAREILGEEFYGEPIEYDVLLKELENYRKYVFSIAERVLRCYSSTSSRA
ncbi:hypothetical protein [Pyrobaculum sp.]|uniref:hypothetical protein n=1 Tax=Pyrobaculum sp. TaxID=2004705 RepID=UPI00317B3257